MMNAKRTPHLLKPSLCARPEQTPAKNLSSLLRYILLSLSAMVILINIFVTIDQIFSKTYPVENSK